MLLEGKNAVLTGSSRGIGYSILEALALNGANIWACLRTKTKEFEQSIDNLSKKNKVSIKPLYFDLENQDAVKDSAKVIIGSKEKIDILINNAGIIHTSAFQMTRIEDVKKVFQVNFFSQILFTQMLVRTMTKQKKGSIINIASDIGVVSPNQNIYKPDNHGYKGVDFNSPAFYSVSKAGVVHLTKYLATYWAMKNVRVNCISPAGVYKGHDTAFVDKLSEQIPMGRMALPNEFKGAIILLASDASSFITGHNLIIDGGRTIW